MKYTNEMKNTIENNLTRLLVISKEEENEEILEIISSNFIIEKYKEIEKRLIYDAKYVKGSKNFEKYQLGTLLSEKENSLSHSPLKLFKKYGKIDKYLLFLNGEIENGLTDQENLQFLKKSSRIGL